MQQLTQKLGSGDMIIQEVPYPQLGKGMVIVKNHYSIISAGTEGSTVVAARKSLIGKAKERPQQVKQVIDTLKKQGPVQTYRAVMKKLDAYSPLGYSCAGEVIEVGEGVTEFEVGDKVACAGAGYANHAEIVSVPINLCVKLDNDSNLKDAAYNTLGAISMQGVRQADLRLGESCVIIGLGLLGQLAALILKASGVTVIGIDVSEAAVKQAVDNKVVDLGLTRNAAGVEEQILNATNGYGADAVIIAAATASLDPINFAGAIARKKGKVVVLGAVPTGFERDPYWYRKELELKMACSYGPGRYDLNYEEKGIDYPLPYVRWTEKRNMEAFQNLIATKKIDIEYLTTHEFDFDNAKEAFDLVVSKAEPFTGIALKYDIEKETNKSKISTSESEKLGKINISFVGAGSYAQGNLLPNIPESNEVGRVGVLTNTGTTSKRVAEKFKFQFCATKEDDVLDDKTNTVFVATRHDSHGSYVLKSLKANKNVFVEKPLCLLESELQNIIELQAETNKSVMVGFNRRFSPLTAKLKKAVGNNPMTMLYRINAGAIPGDTWIQDIEIGGGRVLGEVCHFIDYLTYLNGSLPVKVSASALPDANKLNDTLNILIQFENGSSGVVAYYANGSKSMTKEYVEVFSAGLSATLNDFKELKIYGKGKPKKQKIFNQNKGQKEMVEAFVNGLLTNGKAPIPFEDIVAVTKASFKVLESVKRGGEQVEI
ncbi:Gfo/Idh/MocA family oxidoreductase [Winogradskyella echinorum]|uniref:Gfo/Idh/MocA family oxidoreductase n=1 Tax=Winogradskyella echinorum TaxID=538189 RepID=A0ABR6XXF6_9FLAO|nr:Gfo/Idh/MocA family oxidoreductase [Winogradskyella echinorum]MBC3845162.1 Gfo/Idh/MocA family oxidoreductase [Winogradskyella echinorum]MBC5749510.1 Gfo/Idh/MocA family oxidoreductase [Winogradskyella echinorum]